MIITEYHATRSILDLKFIEQVFARDERDQFQRVVNAHPTSIIRKADNSGGAVPANHDGSVVII